MLKLDSKQPRKIYIYITNSKNTTSKPHLFDVELFIYINKCIYYIWQKKTEHVWS